MIGPKKLSTIREEVARGLSADGGDPLKWLEQQMAACKGRWPVNSDESEIMQSLRRLLEAIGKRRKQPVKAKSKK
jgi:hypothetical protein